MSNSNDPGLGLGPDDQPNHAASMATDIERAHIEYTLPRSMVSRFYERKGFTVEDLTFCMIEITPAQQDRAAKVAGQNPSVLSRELMFAAIWKVGSWKGRDNRQKLQQWWDAIGSKGRRLVEAAFMEMQSVEEADVESFLASGKPKA